MEEVFANQLVSMVKGLPFGDIFQESSSSSQPGSVMHQENSQRVLKVGRHESTSQAALLQCQGRVANMLIGSRRLFGGRLGSARYRIQTLRRLEGRKEFMTVSVQGALAAASGKEVVLEGRQGRRLFFEQLEVRVSLAASARQHCCSFWHMPHAYSQLRLARSLSISCLSWC